MSSLIRETFDIAGNGHTGLAISNTNTTIPVVTVGTGATIGFDQGVRHGTVGYSASVFVGNPAAFTVLRAVNSATDLSLLFTRTYVRFDTIPTSNATFGAVANGSGVVLAGIQLATDGHLRLRNSTTTVDTSTSVIAADTWYGIEWGIDVVAGTQTLRLYDDTHTNIVEELTGAYTGVGLRRWSLGNVAGVPASWQLWFDDVAADNATWVGPLGTAAPDVTIDAPSMAGVGDMTPPAVTTVSTPDLINEHFEGGSNGTTISTSNSTLPSNPTIGSGAAVTFDSSIKHLGALSAKVFVGNPAAFTVMLPVNAGADVLSLYVRGYVMFDTIPAANATWCAFATSAGATLARVQLMPTGQLRVQNGTATTIGTTTTVLAADTWYGFEWHAEVAGATQEFRLYDSDHTDLLEPAITGAYTGTGLRRWQLGNVTGVPNSWNIWFDDLAADDTKFVGPLGVPKPPSATDWLPDGVGGWIPAETVLMTGGVVVT